MARVIAVAYPHREADRVRFSQQDPRPLPPLYLAGAQVLPCDRCAIELNVGPNVQARMQALHLKLLCPECAVRERATNAVPRDVLDSVRREHDAR